MSAIVEAGGGLRTRFLVAQVSKPAVSPISKSAARATSCAGPVWKPAIQQTWKPALRAAGTRRKSGFSLIEVMCAVLVMGVALVALTRGITTALASIKDSELQTTVVSLAAGQLETLRAGGVLLDETTDGDFGESFPKYGWEQTVAPSDIDGLHQVDIVVKDSKSGATLYKLTTLLFDNDYPGSTASDAKEKQREQNKAKNRRRRGQ